MRKCLKYETEIVKKLSILVSNDGYRINIREKGILKRH